MKTIIYKWRNLSNKTKELIYMTIFTWVFILILWFIALPLSILMICVGFVYLDLLWENLNENGYIVQDYLNNHEPARIAFLDFAKIKNRKEIIIPTRYQVGIIQK